MPTVIKGSGSIAFSNAKTSSIATITHNYGSTNYVCHPVLTTVPSTGVALVVLNKTATTCQVQGAVAANVTATLTFDWVVL